jgi:hypothetical protein
MSVAGYDWSYIDQNINDIFKGNFSVSCSIYPNVTLWPYAAGSPLPHPDYTGTALTFAL